MELVFASNNAHKLLEIQAVVSSRITILSLKDIDFRTELPETSGTITGNALQKAWTLFDATGLNCFADDSGLEVKALNGRPGVESAHFAGLERDSAANNKMLLKEMLGITDRSARFVTVIVLIINGTSYLFEGEIKGNIGYEIEGNEGFGYDPVFIPEGYKKSFAALPPEIKNKISHRAKAVFDMNKWLGNNY